MLYQSKHACNGAIHHPQSQQVQTNTVKKFMVFCDQKRSTVYRVSEMESQLMLMHIVKPYRNLNVPFRTKDVDCVIFMDCIIKKFRWIVFGHSHHSPDLTPVTTLFLHVSNSCNLSILKMLTD